MGKRIQQFRYYNPGDTTRNNPSNISAAGLISGSIFKQAMPITDLGIQALPGTKFYLNGSVNPIIIGHSGLYQLNLNGAVRITSLRFDATSVNAVTENENGYIIVDVVYEGV